ncbi:unnamed protein product [Protopolystoma xenopodis]|uniref:Adenosine 3'-phospho 5'-phosphosulfate transporter 1 n=1 Tax=Protopolystoma xenopodis TaxID=117903 RepID=A0A448WHD2_9PLAT|nr:unnamed protein product [Protopolystoma xenopodis]
MPAKRLERIMTRDYDGERFTESQFLVFANRAVSLVIVIIVICINSNFFSRLFGTPNHPWVESRAPLIDYAFSSLSNINSSWCQYEALKFVSFPTQT